MGSRIAGFGAATAKRGAAKAAAAVASAVGGIEMAALGALVRRLQPIGTRAAPRRRTVTTTTAPTNRGKGERTKSRVVVEDVAIPRRRYARRV